MVLSRGEKLADLVLEESLLLICNELIIGAHVWRQGDGEEATMVSP